MKIYAIIAKDSHSYTFATFALLAEIAMRQFT